MKNYVDKLFIVEGILLAFTGILFFVNPLESILGLTFLIGILIILSAVSKLVRGWNSEHRVYCLFSGIIDTLFGIILILSPIRTVEMLLIFYGIWSLMRGLATLMLSLRYKTFGVNFKSIGALIAIVLGFMIILSPYALLFMIPYIPYVIGVYFIFVACLEIYLGASARKGR